MKIGIDISQTIYGGTGTATYFNNLIEWLPKIDSKNSYVHFGSSLRRWRPGFWPLPPSALDILWNRLHVLEAEIFIGPVDIFHASDWTAPPARAKKVAPILDMIVYKYPNSIHPQIVAVQKRRLEWVKKEADAIVTISQNTKNDIINILQIPPEKIFVTHLAANPEFKPQENSTGGYVLTIGSLGNKRKNVDKVVAACEKLKLPLKVIGGGICQADLPKLYADAKCFVYASSYEGFGIPILEAMACGTPVICGRASSMPEVAGNAATYANIEDIDDLADKIKTVKKTGLEISQAAKFSWEKTARQTLEVYESLA